MIRSGVAAMLVVASIALGCSRQQPGDDASPAHFFPERNAWAGIADDGLRVIVEPIAETIHAKPAIASEVDLLRETLAIDPNQQLLRVVLKPDGDSGLPAERGTVRVGGIEYAPMEVMPEGLDAQGRLIWNSVVTGGRDLVPAEGELQHWSYLLLATSPALPNPQDKMSWHSKAFSVDLQSKSWSEAERQNFLDAATQVEDE